MIAGARRLADVGDLTRDTAREAARQELAKPAYDEARPSVFRRFLDELIDALNRVLDGPSVGLDPRLAGVLFVLVLTLVTVVILLRVGPISRQRQQGPLFAGAAPLTADGHRAAADTAAGEGRWADAVRERLRAVVRELEARGVLDPRPGRTADEVAGDAGAAVPDIAAPMREAATLFNEIWYGGREAGPASYDVLVEVDRRVAAARLAPVGVPA